MNVSITQSKMTKEQGQLAKKIESVASEIGSIEKDGTNNHSNYSYISWEAMTRALQDALPKHGLSIVPEVIDVEESAGQTGGGKPMTRSVVKMMFHLIDTDTGFKKSVAFFGAENDSGGKSLQQAITQCTKYFYFKLFKVSSPDDADANTNASPSRGSYSSSNGSTASNTKYKQPDKGWFDEKNAAHVAAVNTHRENGLDGTAIIKAIRDSGMGLSKDNAAKINNGQI